MGQQDAQVTEEQGSRRRRTVWLELTSTLGAVAATVGLAVVTKDVMQVLPGAFPDLFERLAWMAGVLAGAMIVLQTFLAIAIEKRVSASATLKRQIRMAYLEALDRSALNPRHEEEKR